MAGESAREAARRQREKSERLARSAALYERGAEGEQLTADALAALAPEEWTVFHDLRWPGRRYANIDHVVVGPGGVFVIDSKNWTGRIQVAHDVLRQNGRSRERAVVQAAEAALALCRLVPAVSPTHVHPVLCFVRDEPVHGWARDVMVVSTATIVEMLATRPPVLSAQERELISLDLSASAHPAQAAPSARSAGAAPPAGTVQPAPAVPPSVPLPVPLPAPPLGPRRATQVGSPRTPGGRRRAPRGRRRARRRRSRLGLLVGLAIVGALLFAPTLATSAADAFSRWFVSMTTAGTHSVAPTDGACPATHPVKGFTNKAGVRLSLLPGTRRYERTTAERCFDSSSSAGDGGYVEVPSAKPAR